MQVRRGGGGATSAWASALNPTRLIALVFPLICSRRSTPNPTIHTYPRQQVSCISAAAVLLVIRAHGKPGIFLDCSALSLLGCVLGPGACVTGHSCMAPTAWYFVAASLGRRQVAYLFLPKIQTNLFLLLSRVDPAWGILGYLSVASEWRRTLGQGSNR